MQVTIPDQLLDSIGMTERDLKTELALTLFQQDRLTLGQASILCEMPQLDFQRLLAHRRIPLHYTVEAVEQDLEYARGFRSI